MVDAAGHGTGGPGRPDSTRTAAILEEEIVLGLLHPRERLREDALMERFDIKRHIARAALGDLAALGLIERQPNVGAYVREYSAAQVRELYEVRELLETNAAASIRAPLPEAALARLRDIQAEHDVAVEEGDRRGVFRTNVRFHEAFFALAPNSVLVESISLHARRAHAIRFTSFADQALLDRARSEHHALIAALDPLDTATLRRICAEHLRPSRDAYLARVEASDRLR